MRERFERLAARQETAVIPYLVAGYPTLRQTREHLWSVYEGGASIVELGIPFSDPVADGPTISRAANAALKKGATPRKCLDLVASMRKEGFDLPILGMTYANLLFHQGYPTTAKAWARAGLDGAIIPDISLEDAAPFRKAWDQAGLTTTFFAAPSTSPPRLTKALNASTGFLYLVAVYGTTGARRDIAPETIQLLRRALRARDGKPTPVCVGFGVSTPAHVGKLKASGADGVIVGSALLDAIEKGRPVRRFIKDLRRAAISS